MMVRQGRKNRWCAPWIVLASAIVAMSVAACSPITARPPTLMVELAGQYPVSVVAESASSEQRYDFNSWLSFPAVGPWSFEVGEQFEKYANSLRQQLSPGPKDGDYELRLHLTAFDVNTFYRASCAVRATMTERSTGKVVLDRQYVGIGRSAFLRVFWLGWFFGVGTRGALPATASSAFDSAFAKIADDVEDTLRPRR